MRVVFWGTYDTGKPRVRILLRGLKENSVTVHECHASIWESVEDKSQLKNWTTRIKFLIKWALSYPRLIYCYLRLPKHDAVVVGYMGQLDVLIIWPFAKMRGVPIVWDAFLSLYNTVVEDRCLVSRRHPVAYLLFMWEWLACRAANLVLLDTCAHAEYFVNTFSLPSRKAAAVLVGVEPEKFPLNKKQSNSVSTDGRLTILFFGQFIPLHGVDTIIRAAQIMETDPVQWVLIGKGQEQDKIEHMLKEHPLHNLKWIPWVPYEELTSWIGSADICLGIFGDTQKAAQVIPNKVFQILSSGKPLLTRDSPAIQELIDHNMEGIFLVSSADPQAIVDVVRSFSKSPLVNIGDSAYQHIMSQIQPVTIGKRLCDLIAGISTANQMSR